MKATVAALLIASAHAQAEEGTAAIAGGDLDAAGYTWYLSIEDMGLEECDTTADCTEAEENDEGLVNVCQVVFVDDAQDTQGYCSMNSYCGEAGEEISVEDDEGETTISDATWTLSCNTATTEDEGEDLDILDFIAWNKYTDGMDACTADADCGTGEVCGTVSISNLDVLMCTTLAGQCATPILGDDDVATGGWTAGSTTESFGSTNDITVVCTGDIYDEKFWATNNEADQTGACDSSLEAFDSATDECASTETCGTATIDGGNVLGCYPTADCDVDAPTIPGSTTVTYTLVCGATKIMATAAAAFAIAATI